ncbi:uncharacterized protein [Solanum lycopersicum]|uniref:uncharacterized protein n=1 Tax=Solanum lycopersicum TaxID=4081 RepID=UPI003748EA28
MVRKTWEIFKKAFLDRFFPREKKEDKMEEFINLLQVDISILEYSLEFTKLAKFAPFLVSDPRDERSRFVTGVSNDLIVECHSVMLHDNMNISHLIVHAQQVEENRVKKSIKETNRAKSFDGESSKGRLDIQDKPKFKKRFSIQVPSKFPKARDDRVSNPKSNKGRSTSSPRKKPTCGKCGKKHYGDCLYWNG